jgi:patatin-like phospholipase/acyl hydrolase
MRHYISLIFLLISAPFAKATEDVLQTLEDMNIPSSHFQEEQQRLGSDLFLEKLNIVNNNFKNLSGLSNRDLLALFVSESVELERYNFTEEDLSCIETLASQNSYLSTLKLFKCGIDASLATKLSRLPTTITTLDLEENPLGDEGVNALISMTHLKTLKLWKCGVTDQGINILSSSIPNLERLELYKNDITDTSVELLADLTSLTYLDLRKNKITDEGANGLAQNQTLRFLRLDYNHITDNGAQLFVHNTNLEELGLRRNPIEDEKILIFLEFVMPQQALLHQMNIFPIPRHLSFFSNKTVRILSIDGGGIRGLIPALILREIEERMESILGNNTVYLKDHFDFISGTSTGGLIALGLVTPGGEKHIPKYKSQDLVNLYKKKGPQIFPGYIFQSLINLFKAKYDPTPLEHYLEESFENHKLSEALTRLLITAYDMGQRRVHIFDSLEASKNPRKDFIMPFVGRATSAAPTYFPAAQVTNIMNDLYTFSDGGVYANNPTLIALQTAMETFPDAQRYILLSLGTGQKLTESLDETMDEAGLLGWLPNITSVLMNNAANVTTHNLAKLQEMDNRIEIHRLQPTLSGSENKMDDVNKKNLRQLEDRTRAFIADNDELLGNLVQELVQDYQL